MQSSQSLSAEGWLFFLGAGCRKSASAPTRERWPENSVRAGDQLRRANVGRRRGVIRGPNSGEADVAGGDSLPGSFPPARTAFPGTGRQLRRGSAGRRTVCAPATNSGERMLAGGEALSGGRTPAKPTWPEVTVYQDLLLRRGPPSPEQVVSSDEGALAGEQRARRRPIPASECRPEERLYPGAELRRSRRGRR